MIALSSDYVNLTFLMNDKTKNSENSNFQIKLQKKITNIYNFPFNNGKIINLENRILLFSQEKQLILSNKID